MRRLAIVGLAALVAAACQDVTAPDDTAPANSGLTAELRTLTGSFSANAVLSADPVVQGSPITYGVDFRRQFSSISQVDFFFTFGNDPLDSGECLIFGPGFCNPGSTPQTSRLLTIPCSGDPVTCAGFSGGVNSGQIQADRFTGSGAVSVGIASLTVTVHGTTEPTVSNVSIDIRPNRFPNFLNPRGRGSVAVAIFTTPTFDATTIDPLRVRFGPSNAAELHHSGHLEDVDHDGDIDLVLHFRPIDTGIQCGDTSASLRGRTLIGDVVKGSDSVVTEECRQRP